MPRRNRSTQARRRGRTQPLPETGEDLSYDQIALRLVKQGKASRAILGLISSQRAGGIRAQEHTQETHS